MASRRGSKGSSNIILHDSSNWPTKASSFSQASFSLTRDPEHPYNILLIGESGCGKTSFLNLLCNCETLLAFFSGPGPKKAENIHSFNDMRMENAHNCKMGSSTNDAKKYEVEIGGHKVGVIDTPGFGDTRGLQQDKRNTDKILRFLNEEVDYVNCVCLVINGRESRMHKFLRYILTAVTSILPKDILDNVIVVCSNTDKKIKLNFEIAILTEYFGKDIEQNNIFCIDNPYCEIERAKQRGNLEDNAEELETSFSTTADELVKMCSRIKDFQDVYTYRFIELFLKMNSIEQNVQNALLEYENQIKLEKQLKKKKTDLNSDQLQEESVFEQCSKIETEVWIMNQTSDFNVLCEVKGCHSNCHQKCMLPPESRVRGDREFIKDCVCIKCTNFCFECGHSYLFHHLRRMQFAPRINSDPIIDEASMAQLNIQQKAQRICKELESKLEDSKKKRKEISERLLRVITEYEKFGLTRNYSRVIESQLEVIDAYIEASSGQEMHDLKETREDLQKKLKLVREAKFMHVASKQNK